MENSPPGIHTIPLGAGVGAGVVVGTVGKKRSAAGTAAVAGVRASIAGWALAVKLASSKPPLAS